MLSIKVILAIIFVVTGGAVFSSQFGKNKLAVLLAAIVSIVSAYYLFSEIKKDIIKELKEEGTVKEVSVKKEPIAKVKEIAIKKKSIPKIEEIVVKKEPIVQRVTSKKSNKNSIVIDGLRYENRPFTKKYTWEKARVHCSEMKLGNYENWRLPERNELKKLLTKTVNDGQDRGYYIRQEFVKNLNGGWSSWFWSSTIYNKDKVFAWLVLFSRGDDGWDRKVNERYALCVTEQ